MKSSSTIYRCWHLQTLLYFLYIFFSASFLLGMASGRRLSLMASFTNPNSKMKVSG
jgi:hypothetical protein